MENYFMRLMPVIFVVLLAVGLISGFILGSLAYTHTTTIISTVGETRILTVYETVERVVTVIKSTTIKLPSERTITYTATITVTETTHAADGGAGGRCAAFRASKDAYEKSEKVVLILENNCDYALILPNSAPWVILDSEGRIVFSPIAAQVITRVGPGEERKWTWDQRDNEGAQVPAGKYRARLTTLNAGILTAEFEIVESHQSGCACS